MTACADRQANGKVARFAKDRTQVLDFFTQSRFELSRTVVHETSILWLWVKVVAGEDVVAIFAENVGRELQGLVVRKGEVGDGAPLRVLVVFAVELPAFVPQVGSNLLYVFVQGCFVRLAVRFKVDLQAIEVVARIAVAVQVGGVVGKSNDTGVRQVTKVWVEVAEFAAIIVVIGGNLLPAIHARVDQGHDGGHLLLLLVDVRSFLVIRVVVDGDVAGLPVHGGWRPAPFRGAFAGPKLDVTTVGVYNVDLAAIVRALVVLGNLRCPPGTVARRHDVASAARAVQRAVGVGVPISERRVCRPRRPRRRPRTKQ